MKVIGSFVWIIGQAEDDEVLFRVVSRANVRI